MHGGPGIIFTKPPLKVWVYETSSHCGKARLKKCCIRPRACYGIIYVTCAYHAWLAATQFGCIAKRLQLEVWGFIHAAVYSYIEFRVCSMFFLPTMWLWGIFLPESNHGASIFLVPLRFLRKSSLIILMCMPWQVPTGEPIANPIKWKTYLYTGLAKVSF